MGWRLPINARSLKLLYIRRHLLNASLHNHNLPWPQTGQRREQLGHERPQIGKLVGTCPQNNHTKRQRRRPLLRWQIFINGDKRVIVTRNLRE